MGGQDVPTAYNRVNAQAHINKAKVLTIGGLRLTVKILVPTS
ncbi:MAG: hypothetical protein O4803_09230 [Trichodesmium sp. St15_bin1_1]|nr:hypothetical protein [Trichodesmium sp. St18_bin1]MDE5086478.1 hypothetical protein [Trichodesmium sp. St16_bin2-tuft]MDE5105524.1 hypothetical protein [Trichodesmium sp. St17_bin3_1_1]MDE5114420.1 hypothetical protein [Trichodesmium sp. St15_bin1_1]MDE5119195.1 hypothetical protein [Trichodesmium sp. St19_bin1]